MKLKYFFKILLLFLGLMYIFNITSYAASDFTYELNENNNAIITGYTGNSSEIVIPSTIDEYKVTSIANHAFDAQNANAKGRILTKVTISEGIESIGDFAFVDCENLEEVVVPESVVSLGFQTFVGCKKLKNINIPSKVTLISTYCFSGTGLTEITIHENIKTIGFHAFSGCKNLEKVIIYNKDLQYYETPLLQPDEKFDSELFFDCSPNLVLYGYVNSTTQAYAEEKGFNFRAIETLTDPNPVISITSIELNKSNLSLYIGDSESLIATVLPDNATDKSVIWTSSNPNVAIVENGKVTAKSQGKATITVATIDGTKKAECNVVVSPKDTPVTNIPVTSITLNKSTLSLYIGNSEILIATVLPNNATDKSVIWTSSNPNVATVENGKVIAKSSGETTITVSTLDNKIKAICVCNVLVKDDSIAQSKLPETGFTNILIILFCIFFTISGVFFIKYRKIY